MSTLPPHIEHCVRGWWLSSTAWLIGYFALGAVGVEPSLNRPGNPGGYLV